MSAARSSQSLLHLYRRLLRSAATFPTKNRAGLYESIREEFRDNVGMDPSAERTQEQVAVAYKGLEQLRQYDEINLTGGKKGNPNWSVRLEENPMPAPEGYVRRKK